MRMSTASSPIAGWERNATSDFGRLAFSRTAISSASGWPRRRCLRPASGDTQSRAPRARAAHRQSGHHTFCGHASLPSGRQHHSAALPVAVCTAQACQIQVLGCDCAGFCRFLLCRTAPDKYGLAAMAGRSRETCSRNRQFDGEGRTPVLRLAPGTGRTPRENGTRQAIPRLGAMELVGRRGNRPWGPWLLAFGMYGGTGLVALEALQLVPVISACWFPMARENLANTDLRLTLAAALLLAAIDNLLNSGMILPLVLVIGGMSAHSPAAGDIEAGVEDGPGFEKRFSRSTPATPGDGESPAIESGVESAPIYDLGCMAKDSDLREHHWVGRSTASAIRRAPVRSVPAIRSEECAERLKGKPHRAIRVGCDTPSSEKSNVSSDLRTFNLRVRPGSR